ncbi:hypothetical protein [Mucilaginibacter sp. L3T2-6]|uniref:hypothetical protein n=1 Tax=Mucilaginibacter sp. L3T2-6 TaxID=3062491 RepID=UPI0026755F49|nr:hypothetical protein [Mucilaginibacter sp. L3T2-6]MDO3643147.1 hypothetical protein [Mucilaginibacter sp. L3T2-6]MDV6217763.1 hypothetical protein [Mucilaginibacter sp. L3T2-6]
MDTLDNLKQLWLQDSLETNTNETLNKETMEKIIKPQIKKEQNYIKEYLLAFAVWQILVYAALSHFMVRYWADRQFVLCCAIGILSFIPYSIIFHRHANCVKLRALKNPDAPLAGLQTDLSSQIKQVSSYFTFKKRFDYIGIPVISFVMMAIIMKVSPVPHTITAGAITFGITLAIMARTTYVQNKNNFELPLAKLRLILADLTDTGS